MEVYQRASVAAVHAAVDEHVPAHKWTTGAPRMKKRSPDPSGDGGNQCRNLD